MGLFDWLRGRSGKAREAAPARPADPRAALLEQVRSAALLGDLVDAAEPVPADYALNLRRASDGVWLKLHLENLYLETREAQPEKVAERIQFWLGGLTEDLEDDWESARQRLLPVVRPWSEAASVSAEGELELFAIQRRFLPHLPAALVQDTPRSMHYFSDTALATWGVDRPTAFDAALANATRLAAEPLVPEGGSAGPLLQVPGEDPYAATRLLVPGWLASMADRVEGRPLAIVPERCTILVGGDARPELVRLLATTAQREYRSSNRSLSPAVYTVDEAGAVVPYLPGGSGEVARLVRLGHLLLETQSQAEQVRLLDECNGKKDVDLFVALADIARLKDGRAGSWCTWVEGIPSLLPRTTAVAVAGNDGTREITWRAFLPFEVARELGGWTEAPMLVGPPRWKVSGVIPPELKREILSRSTDIEAILAD